MHDARRAVEMCAGRAVLMEFGLKKPKEKLLGGLGFFYYLMH